MKPIHYFTLFFLLITFFNNCTKEKSNIPSDCTILSPEINAQYKKGENVTILVDASDIDGQIEKVILDIIGVLLHPSTSNPYKFEWNASNISVTCNTQNTYEEGNYTQNKRKSKPYRRAKPTFALHLFFSFAYQKPTMIQQMKLNNYLKSDIFTIC